MLVRGGGQCRRGEEAVKERGGEEAVKVTCAHTRVHHFILTQGGATKSMSVCSR